MKVTNLISISIAMLAGVAVLTPSVTAKNLAKYTNIPFVVAAHCPASSAQIVTSGGKTKVVAAIDTASFDAGGFDIYCSNPSTGTGPNSATGTFPEGTLSFTISGLPSGGGISAVAVYTDNPASFEDLFPVLGSNGFVTIPVNNPFTTPGSPVIEIQVSPTTASGTATVQMYNMVYNNSTVLFDTTVTDTGTTGIDFCT